MAKKEQSQLILWAVVALVLGVLIGVLLTSAVTTGSAISVTSKDSKLQEDITEVRQDLVLNLLKVNRIENRQNALELDSTSDIDLIASDSITMNSGVSKINMYADAADGPKIIINSNLIKIGGSGNSVVDIGNNYTNINFDDLTIDIRSPQVKFSQLHQIEQPNHLVEYFIGDTFIANTYIVEVINIWDANGIVEMQLRKEGSPPRNHFYEEGDYIVPDLVQVSSIDSNSVFVVFYPSTDAYLCIHKNGSIYRSLEPCN